jgi:hypothetical protein
MLADAKARADAFATDLDKLESYLSKTQIKYLDNMDFDGTQYGIRSESQSGSGGAGGTSGAGGFDRSAWQGNGSSASGTRPDAATIQRMQEQMQKQRREQQERLVKLYKQVYDLLKLRVK